MTRKLFYLTIFAVITGLLGSCNSHSDDPDVVGSSAATVVVSSFSLSRDLKVMVGLDSVFFSIDLANARIYNADSLPYGTKTDKLVPKIGVQGCTVAELYVKRANLPDTIYDYMTNSTDTIDFSQGPVKLHIVAADGKTERDYMISVNVHQMKADSLYWDRAARRPLPSKFAIPSRQKTVKFGDDVYCLTASGNEYSMAKASNPSGEWVVADASFPFTPNLESFTATDDAFYMLDDCNTLWRSVDAIDWQSTSTTMTHIYGGYGSTLLGVDSDAQRFYHVTYPATTRVPVADGFPVSGTSQMIVVDTKWSTDAQAYMMGGRDSQGRVNGSMWGFDGKEWQCVSADATPAAADKTFFSYTTFVNNKISQTSTAYTTFFCFGGRDANGHCSGDVYISLDNGLHWKKGDALVQLPSYIAPMAQTQAFVFDTTLSVDPARGWTEYSAPQRRRVSAPITQWECPYVYLFGGVGDNGSLFNNLWRGVINRLSFVPLY